MSRPSALAEYDERWREDAACRELGARLFFRPAAGRALDRERTDAAAEEVCALCPVQRDCLRHALEAGEPAGIRGGLTARERRRLRTAEEALSASADRGRSAVRATTVRPA
ncbi:WhiB family transcriptional regulator [Streptomyces sp. ISL-66]|uniref:WhiB family transcriptional regulator n=1 Tax=Streptomyces sp. ISL-66 TaxID=2819186 RepID=UPI0027E4020F|nr:WhiB family transcriptional regulator [Streptomyces sp. ISL-66]